MRQLKFVTGNKNKFYEASTICEKYDIQLVQSPLELREIQHHDALEITRAKVMEAYKSVVAAVVVNDSTWEIPALGGFPGGYMKDISEWLRAKDFKALMHRQEDKRILLIDTVAYYDGTELHIVSHKRIGHFLTDIDVDPEASFDSIVQMEQEPTTIAEILKKVTWDVSSAERYTHWYEFAKWYSKYTRQGEN